jgi:hypothetical protein
MQPTNKNQFQRARTIIQSLVHGLDPETGHELPKDSIVNKIEVNRALSTGVLSRSSGLGARRMLYAYSI